MNDIVIRGMEMPNTGSRIIEINFRGEVFELFKTDNGHGGFLKSRKLEAVELPEHGDLIDRRKLWKDTEGLGEYCYDTCFAELCDAISEAPTILGASK